MINDFGLKHETLNKGNFNLSKYERFCEKRILNDENRFPVNILGEGRLIQEVMINDYGLDRKTVSNWL